jgi:hypothetical protein
MRSAPAVGEPAPFPTGIQDVVTLLVKNSWKIGLVDDVCEPKRLSRSLCCNSLLWYWRITAATYPTGPIMAVFAPFPPAIAVVSCFSLDMRLGVEY